MIYHLGEDVSRVTSLICAVLAKCKTLNGKNSGCCSCTYFSSLEQILDLMNWRAVISLNLKYVQLLLKSEVSMG